MFLKKAFFYLNALVLPILAVAQENIPIGQWRVHLPYNSSSSVEVAGNRIYASSTINGFYLDQEDNSTHILSTVNGLNDIEISALRYHEKLDLLLIAYSNGNLDAIINGNTIVNISDIKRKNTPGSKKINDIYFHENLAYLSTDFGIVVLNLKKFEVKETYATLAPSGISNKVYGCTFSADGDSIFLATSRGVMAAKSTGANLMDYSNWYTYGAANNITNNNIRGICTFQNKVYAVRASDNLAYLAGNTWVTIPITLPGIHKLKVSEEKLVVCTDWGVIVLESESSLTLHSSPSIPAPRDARIDRKGIIWIADATNGLVSLNTNGSIYTHHQPDGPSSTDAFDLYYYDKKIIASRGGYTAGYAWLSKQAEYYVFENNAWTTYNHATTPGFPPLLDILNAAYNPKDKKLYLPAYGYGVMVLNPDNSYTILNDTNTPFIRYPAQAGPFVRITDSEVDKQGNVWFTNSFIPLSANPSLYVLKTDGTWDTKAFPGVEGSRHSIQILIDDNDNKWIRIRINQGGGVIVYNDKTNQYKYLTTNTSDGKLPSQGVRTMAKDKKGEIWLGTEEGIAIFYNPENIFSNPTPEASQPIFDGFPLLYNEYISCIKIDGGNRKWIGTKNGVWLFNDEGSEVIANYTTQNSPLLSNDILDIEIHEETGEVFIATGKGIISFRGTATEGGKEHSNVKVFPNPVKPDYGGLIGISGLASDAVIKITDIYGNLVYETQAQGGSAVWNAKNYNGQRAKTGVYLVFSASEDGEESFVAKIAVVE